MFPIIRKIILKEFLETVLLLVQSECILKNLPITVRDK